MFNNNAISQGSPILQVRYRSIIPTQYKKRSVFIIKLANSRPKFHCINTKLWTIRQLEFPSTINIFYMAYYNRWINVYLAAILLAPTCSHEKQNKNREHEGKELRCHNYST